MNPVNKINQIKTKTKHTRMVSWTLFLSLSSLPVFLAQSLGYRPVLVQILLDYTLLFPDTCVSWSKTPVLATPVLPPFIHFQAAQKKMRQSTKTVRSCNDMCVGGLDCVSVKHFATANKSWCSYILLLIFLCLLKPTELEICSFHVTGVKMIGLLQGLFQPWLGISDLAEVIFTAH